MAEPNLTSVRPADGTVVRCTRMTPFGRDVVHGTVRSWHNEEGWIVAGPYGGIAAGPGVEQYLGTAPTDDSEWTISSLEDASVSALVALEPEQQELIADALGYLYAHAPTRRAELVALAEATGLSIMGDDDSDES